MKIRRISDLISGSPGAPAVVSPLMPPRGISSAAIGSTQGQPVRKNNFDLANESLARIVEAGLLNPTNAFGQVARWPRSAATGRGFHGLNCIALAARAIEQGFQSDQWCTFDRAQKNGWRVKAGERHEKVFMFKTVERDTGEVDEITGEPVIETFPSLRQHQLFNLDQLEIGAGTHPCADRHSFLVAQGDAEQMLLRVADNMGIEAIVEPGRGQSLSEGDCIRVSSIAQLAQSLLRVAMSEGVRQRSGRPPSGDAQLMQIDAEERLTLHVAQSMLSMKIGVGLDIPDLSAEDHGWAFNSAGGKSLAMRVAGRAEQAVNYVLAFDPELRDEIVSERQAMYDEILDAEGDAAVFDGSTLILDQVHGRAEAASALAP